MSVSCEKAPRVLLDLPGHRRAATDDADTLRHTVTVQGRGDWDGWVTLRPQGEQLQGGRRQHLLPQPTASPHRHDGVPHRTTPVAELVETPPASAWPMGELERLHLYVENGMRAPLGVYDDEASQVERKPLALCP